jgi:heterodisulfide reductase subunit A
MTGKVGAVLVVGGGISGMQSALDLADSGFKVYLLDKSPSIGGVMAQLDKTFPTNDCSMCIMAPKLVATGRHHNIETITFGEIDEVIGKPGNFKVKILKNPRRVDLEKCTGCGVCAEKCPVEAIDDYNEGLVPRAGIFVKYPQAVPLVFAIDKDKCIGCGNCERYCKAEAIEYNQEPTIKEIEVGSIILSPGFEEYDPKLSPSYGYSIYPNVLSSIEFERLLSATGPFLGTVLRPSDGEVPQKVAFIQCVGSRDEQCNNEYCSSVCCMYAIKEAIIAQEHTSGLKSHIFFMDIRAFGKEFDDYYNRAEKTHGIKFTRCRIASIEEDPKTNDLILTYIKDGKKKQEKFNLVVLSLGFTPPHSAKKLNEKLGIKLNEYGFCDTKLFSPLETSKPGIFVSGAFSSPKDIPMTVADASGAAAKASSLISSERNTLVTEKKYPPEINVMNETPRIGAFICKCGINIGSVVDVPGVVEYMKTLPYVVYSEWNLYTCSQDTQEKIVEKIKEHNLNRVIVASCTPRTHEPLFQNTIREAGLNPHLFEMANIRDQCSWVHMHIPEMATEKAKELSRMAVAKAIHIEPLTRAEMEVNSKGLVIGGGISGMTAALELADQGFETYLVEQEKELGGSLLKTYYVLGKDDPQTLLQLTLKKVKENKKIHVFTKSKIKEIQGYIGNFKTTILNGKKETELGHGIVILSTGAKEYTPKEYLYGKDKRVLTQSELEEKLAKKSFSAKRVVMIQCVGSRDEERSYCSRTCCGDAIKNALKIKEISPDTDIYILYKDIRTYGFKEKYYKHAAEKGIVFIRYDDENPPDVNNKNDLQVLVKDHILDRMVKIKIDMLVLSTGMLPQDGTEQLSQMLKLPTTKDGFFLEAHMKLRPVDFATEGVFLCGNAHSPKYIDECISQASAAASRACTVLSKATLETEPLISEVNKDMCAGCGLCKEACPYSAIELVDGKADVNAAICKGCGLCAATCRSGAIQQKGFKDQQLLSMIKGSLYEVF